MKFLINCSFGHYPFGSCEMVEHFALIITCFSTEINLQKSITEALKELNFKPNSMGDFKYLTFTAQLI